MIEPQRRDQRIDELLQKYHKSRKNRIIVFVLYKKEASRVEAQLGKKGWKVSPLPVAVGQCQCSSCFYRSGLQMVYPAAQNVFMVSVFKLVSGCCSSCKGGAQLNERRPSSRSSNCHIHLLQQRLFDGLLSQTLMPVTVIPERHILLFPRLM